MLETISTVSSAASWLKLCQVSTINSQKVQMSTYMYLIYEAARRMEGRQAERANALKDQKVKG